MEEIYFAGGCLWGVQEFIKHLPGVIATEAGRANGMNIDTTGKYDGYAECVRTQFDPQETTVEQLMVLFLRSSTPLASTNKGKI